MDTYQGTCKYCGAVQPIMAESQEAADEQISAKCDCGSASTAQKKAKLMERINYIAAGKYNPAFAELTEDQTKILRQGGNDVMAGICTGVTFEFYDSKVKILDTGEKYKVKRTGSREEVVEIE